MHTTTTPSEALPGLELRTRLALARVQNTFDPEGASHQFESVWNDTYTAGHDGVLMGQFAASRLIASDVFLIRAWHSGQDEAIRGIIQPVST